MSEHSLFIAICDDDPVFLQKLDGQCHEILCGEYAIHTWSTVSPQELLAHNDPVDIVLLDMQFPDQDGVSIAQDLLQKNPLCQIIFVSGFLTSVSPAYDVPHLAMILKDQLDEHLRHFLLRAASLVDQSKETTLQISAKKEQLSLQLTDISAIERIGHWTYFHRIDEDSTVPLSKKTRTREKLSDLLERIGNPQFCRCHISYVINLQNVQTLQKHDFVMRIGNGQTMLIPISRFYETACQDAFFQHLSDTSFY